MPHHENRNISKENKMSPMWHESPVARNGFKILQCHFKLTHTEEALIARSVHITIFMKLKGLINGQIMGTPCTLCPYYDRVQTPCKRK